MQYQNCMTDVAGIFPGMSDVKDRKDFITCVQP